MARWADFATCAVSGAAVTLRGLPASNGSGDLLLTQIPICQRAPSGVPRGLTLRTPHWVPVAPENRERKGEKEEKKKTYQHLHLLYLRNFIHLVLLYPLFWRLTIQPHTQRCQLLFLSEHYHIFPNAKYNFAFLTRKGKARWLAPPGLRNAGAELGRRSLDSVVYAAQ